MVQGNRSLKKLARKIQAERGLNYTDALGVAQLQLDVNQGIASEVTSRAFRELFDFGKFDITGKLNDEALALHEAWASVLVELNQGLPKNSKSRWVFSSVNGIRGFSKFDDEVIMLYTDGTGSDEDLENMLSLKGYTSSEVASWKATGSFGDVEDTDGISATPDKVATIQIIIDSGDIYTPEFYLDVAEGKLVKDILILQAHVQEYIAKNKSATVEEVVSAKEVIKANSKLFWGGQTPEEVITDEYAVLMGSWVPLLKSLNDASVGAWKFDATPSAYSYSKHDKELFIQSGDVEDYETHLVLYAYSSEDHAGYMRADFTGELNPSGYYDISSGVACKLNDVSHIMVAMADSPEDHVYFPYNPSTVVADIRKAYAKLTA